MTFFIYDLTHQIHNDPEIMKKYINLRKCNESPEIFEILIDTPKLSNSNPENTKILIKNLNYIVNNNGRINELNSNIIDSPKLSSNELNNENNEDEINTNIKFPPTYNKDEVSNVEINLKATENNNANIDINEGKIEINEEYTVS